MVILSGGHGKRPRESSTLRPGASSYSRSRVDDAAAGLLAANRVNRSLQNWVNFVGSNGEAH